MEGVGFHLCRNALFQCHICLHPACVDRFRSLRHRVCKRCRSRSSRTRVHPGHPSQAPVATSVGPAEWRGAWNGRWVSLLALLRSADRSGDPRVGCWRHSPVDDGIFWRSHRPRKSVVRILDFGNSRNDVDRALLRLQIRIQGA